MLAMTLLADHPKEAALGAEPPDPHGPGTGHDVGGAAEQRTAVGQLGPVCCSVSGLGEAS